MWESELIDEIHGYASIEESSSICLSKLRTREEYGRGLLWGPDSSGSDEWKLTEVTEEAYDSEDLLEELPSSVS